MAKLALEPIRRDSTDIDVRLPLDLAAIVPEAGKFDEIVIRICGLPVGAGVSAGRNNGDQSWTVNADRLEGLDYLPGRPDFRDHTLGLKIIGLIGGDEGEVIDCLELAVNNDRQTPKLYRRAGEYLHGPMISFDQIRSPRPNGAQSSVGTDVCTTPRLDGPVADYFGRLTHRLASVELEIELLMKELGSAAPMAGLSEPSNIQIAGSAPVATAA